MKHKQYDFSILCLTLFVSSLQQSASLDAMKNMVSVINQESASKSKEVTLMGLYFPKVNVM